MKKNGFTLMELMLTVVVIAVLVSIAIPTYISTTERARGREAQSALEAMHAAERTYASERRTYVALGATDPEWLMVGLENANLNANRSWNYTFSIAGIGTAARRAGPNTGETIIMNDDGSEGPSTFTP